MSSGQALTIPCSQHPTVTPLDVRTVTRNTVQNTHCEVDDSRIAKQVVKLKLSPPGTPINIHLKIECNGSELVLTSTNGNQEHNAELDRNVIVGNQEIERKFHFKQQHGVSGSTTEKIHIDIWHSGQNKVPDDAKESIIQNSATYWGQLDPEIELV